MTPGALLLKLRMKFGDGLRVYHYRDNVRPRILETRPIEGTTDSTCEIHVLTSAQDWLNLLWALKSFYWASEKAYALCIHEDGSLSAEQRTLLQQHFPDARVIAKAEADAFVTPLIADFPRIQALRADKPLALKVIDFPLMAESDRLFLVDSDVLFFSEPEVLLQRLEDPEYRLNSVNPDVQTAYSVPPATILEHCGVEMVERFNSGLGVIQRDSIRLEWMEEFLGLPGYLDHMWLYEQTLFAICSCRYGVELLPDEYAVYFGNTDFSQPSRHYVGRVRTRMYAEGIRHLVKAGFLDDLSV